MIALCRMLSAVLIAVLMIAATASAEGEVTVAVNADPGIYDQPSAVRDGNIVHVTFIRADTLAGPFRVWYAVVNGGVDFKTLPPDNPEEARNRVIIPSPIEVFDPLDPLSDPYLDARHPRIARRKANEFVIFFQARPSAVDDAYRLYRALIVLDNNQVVSRSVREVTGATPGDIQDVSFDLVSADNTARVAYASRPAADFLFQVYYARIGLDNAAVVGTPILLSSGDNSAITGSDGVRPVPSLKRDSLNRAHIAWASKETLTGDGAIYYALVRPSGSFDEVAIAATPVRGGALSWDHPAVLVSANNSIIVLAADARFPGLAGEVGAVEINPDAAPKDPFIVNGRFLGNSRLFRPEAFLDTTKRIHMTGYGSPSSGGVYEVVNLTTLFTTQEYAAQREFGRDGLEISGDYTKAAFAFLSGKTAIFWSGRGEPGSRNLNVTTVRSVLESDDESGCAIVRNPGRGGSGRIPEGLLILLPVIVLGIRRLVRRRLAT